MYNTVTIAITINIEVMEDLVELSKRSGAQINDLCYTAIRGFVQKSLRPDDLSDVVNANRMANIPYDFLSKKG